MIEVTKDGVDSLTAVALKGDSPKTQVYSSEMQVPTQIQFKIRSVFIDTYSFDSDVITVNVEEIELEEIPMPEVAPKFVEKFQN